MTNVKLKGIPVARDKMVLFARAYLLENNLKKNKLMIKVGVK